MQTSGAFLRLTFTMLPMRFSRLLLFLCLAALALAGDYLWAATSHIASQSQKSSSTNTASKSNTSVSRSPKAGARKKRVSRRSRRRHPRGQSAPTPDRIREIQSALARGGFYKSQPTGKWDSASIEAMIRFQTSQGLQPTGKLDARSLQALGLGSDVVGQASPRDPSSSQSTTSNSSPGAATPAPSSNSPMRPTAPPPRPPAPKSASSDPPPPPRR